MSAATLSNTLASRFGWLFEGLCKVIGVEAHKRGMEAALAWAVWNRVRLLGERFMALAARAQAGRLRGSAARREVHPPPRPSPSRGEGEGPADAVAEKPQAVKPLPAEFGWVTTVLPRTAQFAGMLAWLLRDPETAALVEVAPEAGRILRPLCHLLGVEAPEFLRRGYVAMDPPPHLASPPPSAERGDDGGVVAAEAPVTVEVAVAVDMPAPPPAPPPRPRPGGLVLDGQRLVWS